MSSPSEAPLLHFPSPPDAPVGRKVDCKSLQEQEIDYSTSAHVSNGFPMKKSCSTGDLHAKMTTLTENNAELSSRHEVFTDVNLELALKDLESKTSLSSQHVWAMKEYQKEPNTIEYSLSKQKTFKKSHSTGNLALKLVTTHCASLPTHHQMEFIEGQDDASMEIDTFLEESPPTEEDFEWAREQVAKDDESILMEKQLHDLKRRLLKLQMDASPKEDDLASRLLKLSVSFEKKDENPEESTDANCDLDCSIHSDDTPLKSHPPSAMKNAVFSPGTYLPVQVPELDLDQDADDTHHSNGSSEYFVKPSQSKMPKSPVISQWLEDQQETLNMLAQGCYEFGKNAMSGFFRRFLAPRLQQLFRLDTDEALHRLIGAFIKDCFNAIDWQSIAAKSQDGLQWLNHKMPDRRVVWGGFCDLGETGKRFCWWLVAQALQILAGVTSYDPLHRFANNSYHHAGKGLWWLAQAAIFSIVWFFGALKDLVTQRSSVTFKKDFGGFIATMTAISGSLKRKGRFSKPLDNFFARRGMDGSNYHKLTMNDLRSLLEGMEASSKGLTSKTELVELLLQVYEAKLKQMSKVQIKELLKSVHGIETNRGDLVQFALQEGF